MCRRRLADGTLSTRSYSIASSPHRTDAYEIAVLHEPEGKGGSAAVHQDFALGVRLNCGLPSNAFALVDVPHKAVLIAGGIGITPIKAMATRSPRAGRGLRACTTRSDPARRHRSSVS